MSKDNVVTSDSAAPKTGPQKNNKFNRDFKGGRSKGSNNTKRVNKPQKKG
jgi:hypothetical protein